jgi:spermidine/putrescine transport system permease protein
MTRAQTTAFLAPGLGWLALFLLLPCLLLLLNATLAADGRFTLALFQRALAPENRELLFGSLRLAGWATLIALLLGGPAGWAIAVAPERRQPLLLVLILLPFFTSALFRSYAWTLLLQADGAIPAALQATGLTDAPVDLTGHAWSVVLGLVYSYLPFVVFAVYAALRRQDPALREASANLGASRWRTFRRISLPLTLPGLVQGALFVFVLSLGNFLVPDLLGGRAVPTLGTEIYDRFMTAPDWPYGSALASLLVGAMLLLLLAQALLAPRKAVRR